VFKSNGQKYFQFDNYIMIIIYIEFMSCISQPKTWLNNRHESVPVWRKKAMCNPSCSSASILLLPGCAQIYGPFRWGPARSTWTWVRPWNGWGSWKWTERIYLIHLLDYLVIWDLNNCINKRDFLSCKHISYGSRWGPACSTWTLVRPYNGWDNGK